MADEPVIRARFKPTPEGGFHPGIPDRDLTNEEYLALDPDQRRTVRRSPIYSYVMAKDLPGGGAEPDDDQPDNDQPDNDQPIQPDDPVTDEPAAAADEGETS